MARMFDGVDDNIAFGSGAAEFLSAFTATAWIKFASDFTAERQILTKMDSYIGKIYLFGTDDTNPNDFGCYISRATAPQRAFSVADALTAGVWNFVCATCDGSNAPKLYATTEGFDAAEVTYNLQEAGSGAYSGSDAAFLRVGSRDTLDTFWTGEIAEVGLWNRVLSAGEIQQLGRGYAPSYFPEGALQYLPLSGQNSPELRSGSGSITLGVVTGTTKSGHPSIMKYPGGEHGKSIRPRPFCPGVAR